jgi:hypothetical protein
MYTGATAHYWLYIYIQKYFLNLDFHIEAYMTMNKIRLSEY